MVSFRNLFLGLVAGSFIASAASAQSPIQYSCSTSAVNNVIRQEGLSELVGTVTINCNILNPQVDAITQVGYVTVKTDGPNITNLQTDSKTKLTTAKMSSAVAAAGGGFGTFVTPNEVDFNNVSFTFPGSATTFQITVENVHVNANQVSAGTPVKLFITALAGYPNNTTQPLQVLLVNAPVTVAQVQTGLTFSTTPYDKNQLVQCAAVAAPVAAGDGQSAVVFTPGFALAFKSNESIDSDGTAANKAASAGGTQLIARFKVPANAKLWVRTTVTAGPGDKAVATLDPASVAVWTEITADKTTGEYRATWTVTALDPGNLAAPFTMPVAISFASDPLVATTGLTANGNLGPMSAVGTSTADKAVYSPRFVDANGEYKTLISTVNLCSTTLLFPHVTSNGGWETGIAISNPSLDYKKADGTYLLSGSTTAFKPQSGTCSLYFFNDNGSAPTAQATTAKVEAGGQFVLLVGTAGSILPDTTITPVTNFQGYVIAQCGFQGAAGFAFMTSGTGQGGVGYKATVIGNQFGGNQLAPLFY